MALLCRTDQDARPAHAGISILLVEQPRPGLTFGRDLPKLGYKGVESCEVFLDHCRVHPGQARDRHSPFSALDRIVGLRLGRIFAIECAPISAMGMP